MKMHITRRKPKPKAIKISCRHSNPFPRFLSFTMTHFNTKVSLPSHTERRTSVFDNPKSISYTKEKESHNVKYIYIVQGTRERENKISTVRKGNIYNNLTSLKHHSYLVVPKPSFSPSPRRLSAIHTEQTQQINFEPFFISTLL
jgi:hypothetical protein